MPPLALAIGLAGLVASSSAQANSNEIVWSSVSFVLYGDRTPLQGTTPSLTPLGADQLVSQGSLFRSRYLDNKNYTHGEGLLTDHAFIHGIEVNAIDNSQLTIYSSTESYISASAFAFMQGLYPPSTQSFTSGTGGLEAATLANGSLLDYPLAGYQYPNILAASSGDPESIW